MTKRITLSDVAKKAGVSMATASAVLNGKAGKSIRVGEERRRKILELASQLGYVPNTSAQNLKAGDDNHIIAVFTYENIFPADPKSEYYPFFAGIQREAEREGYDILILNNWAKEKSRSSRIRLASGAIMIGVTRDDEHITSLVKQDFPLLFVGRREIGGNLPVNYVTFNYKKAVSAIVKAIVPFSEGHIVYVSSRFSSAEPSADKSRYLNEFCKENGIDVTNIVISDIISPSELEAVISSRAVVFDRLFIADYFTPFFMKRNLVVGRDVFGAILEDDWIGNHSQWTRWENKRVELGELSVKRLVSLLSDSRACPETVIDIPVIEGISTTGLVSS